MDIFLDDSNCRQLLFPFTLTRHTADIRIGICTIREKWEKLTNANVHTIDAPQDAIVIPANIVPSGSTFKQIIEAAQQNKPIADVLSIKHPSHIFQYNEQSLRDDFSLLTNGRTSMPISETNKYIFPENIFIEEGASIEFAILNASAGPIYIGKNATIMEGCFIRGPFALCDNGTLKMGAKIYGTTTIGPFCVAAGEIKNSVMFGYSNKAHDGYLGDSVIGEWCNLGAGTSNSNVKNTGGAVKYFLNNNEEMISAGNKGGLLMGDYSRAAINTSFNTGTVVGICCNIFGDVSTRKYIPDFTWGNEIYQFDKAIRDIDVWKKMKGKTVTECEIKMLRKLYDQISTGNK